MTRRSESTTLREAVQLRKRGKYSRALRVLKTLQAANPKNAQLNYECAWLCDVQGKEREAVGFYEQAIRNGLTKKDLRRALLGLGSTYRCLGSQRRAAMVLRRGQRIFPTAREFPVFLALVQYNQGKHAGAMGAVLRALAETTADSGLRHYQRALLYYAGRLNKKRN